MRRLKLMILIGLLTGCGHFELGIEPPITATSQVTATRSPAFAKPTIEDTLMPTASARATASPATASPATSTATMAPTATRRPVVHPTVTQIEPSPTAAPTVQPARIVSFTLEPVAVNPGESVTLRWTTIDAGDVELNQYLPDTVPYSETLSLPLTGELTQIILDRERQWHVFELAAINGAGRVTQSVRVSIRCPDTYFFSPLPAADQAQWDCPDGPAIPSSAAEQVFDNGRMIWLQHDERIYVLLNDGAYRTYDDTWVAGQPDTVPGLKPPEGRIAPVRGFGKVWSGDAELRSQLGWALAPEQGFETQVQGGWIHCCSQLATVNRPIYMRNFAGQIVRLWAGETPPGQWSVFTP